MGMRAWFSRELVADAVEGTLSIWSRGREGIVTEVPSSSLLGSRLREMGVMPGVRVRVLQTGSPLVVQVGAGRLCLRKQDADFIRVRAIGPDVPPPPLAHLP